MGKIIYQAIAFCLLVLISCKKENNTAVPPAANGKKVFVVCEGSLGNGNAQLDLYLPEKDSFYQNVFQQINGVALGDVFQSMNFIDRKYFLCINNSDKIVVLDSSLHFKGNIAVSKPRYIISSGNKKAFVSSLFGNSVFVLNTATLQIEDTLFLPYKNSEGMLLESNNVWVCAWDTANENLYKIDATTNTISDSFPLGVKAPQEIILDKENKAWVLAGNVAKGVPASLLRIDLTNKQVLQILSFPVGADVVKPTFNDAKDTLYFLEVNYNGGTQNNGVYRMNIHNNQLPTQAFIPALQNQYFWALGICPWNGDVYVGDPKGFVQKGSVLIYGVYGSLKKQFTCGVGLGHFYFVP
jgi:DNA-binding beta-propeller fold protein YncE